MQRGSLVNRFGFRALHASEAATKKRYVREGFWDKVIPHKSSINTEFNKIEGVNNSEYFVMKAQSITAEAFASENKLEVFYVSVKLEEFLLPEDLGVWPQDIYSLLSSSGFMAFRINHVFIIISSSGRRTVCIGLSSL